MKLRSWGIGRWGGVSAIVGAACCSIAGCRTDVELTVPVPFVVTCDINREECTGFVFDGGGNPSCPNQNIVVQSFTATACFSGTHPTPTLDQAFQACEQYCTTLYDLDIEQCEALVRRKPNGVDLDVRDSLPGECFKIQTASNGPTAKATCTRGGRACAATQTSGGKTICTDQSNLISENVNLCFDPTKETAYDLCTNNNVSATIFGIGIGVLKEPRLVVTDVQLNGCPPPAPPAALIAYGIGTGLVGTVNIGGVATPLTATGGSVVVDGACDGNGENCIVPDVRSMRVTFADTVVQGVTVQNLEGRLAAPAPIVVTNGVPRIPRANLQLELSGTFLGGTSRVQVSPTQDVPLQLDAQSVSFTAPFSALVPALNNVVVPVTGSITFAGSTSNPGAACGGFSILQTLLGFEDLGWTSTQASLSLSATRHTQGCYGLNVAGGGYMVVNSARFATPLPSLSPTLALDVFVPTGQPNPYWLGAVQLYASCPSGGMNNAYLGQVELTGKPTGAFSTLTYPVGSGVMATLSQTHNDCFFSVAVNVNATPTPVVLDNLRFLP